MLTANAANSASLEDTHSPSDFSTVFPADSRIFLPPPLGAALDSCWRWKLGDKVTQSLIEILKGICTKLGRISRSEENTKGLTFHNSKLVLHIIRYIENKAKTLFPSQMESEMQRNHKTWFQKCLEKKNENENFLISVYNYLHFL